MKKRKKKCVGMCVWRACLREEKERWRDGKVGVMKSQGAKVRKAKIDNELDNEI